MDFKKIINEELSKILTEAEEKKDGIESKLMKLREKLIPAMLKKDALGDSQPRMVKKVPIKEVSDIIDVPLNDLTLYFLNEIKTKNSRSLVEYHSGLVHFFAV